MRSNGQEVSQHWPREQVCHCWPPAARKCAHAPPYSIWNIYINNKAPRLSVKWYLSKPSQKGPPPGARRPSSWATCHKKFNFRQTLDISSKPFMSKALVASPTSTFPESQIPLYPTPKELEPSTLDTSPLSKRSSKDHKLTALHWKIELKFMILNQSPLQVQAKVEMQHSPPIEAE